MKPPGVKVCGVTRVTDAQVAIELGAQFIGLNFWPESPRHVSTEAARSIVKAVRGKARLVGVWVNPTYDEVVARDRELSLDLHQFHGNDDPISVSWFPDRVIRALRLGSARGSLDLSKYDGAWGFLLDSAPDGVYGGTGQSWSYERIANLETSKPVFLAGGLSPENVARAIAQSGVGLVDVCSGVEVSPGIKDPDLLERFFKEVRNVQKRDE